MRAPKKQRQNLAAEKLAGALQEIVDSEREKILVRLQRVLDSARKKLLGSSKGSKKRGSPKKLRKKRAKS